VMSHIYVIKAARKRHTVRKKRFHTWGEVFGRDYLYAKHTQSAACAARIRSTEPHLLTLARRTILKELWRELMLFALSIFFFFFRQETMISRSSVLRRTGAAMLLVMVGLDILCTVQVIICYSEQCTVCMPARAAAAASHDICAKKVLCAVRG
jgi:hypothetical protein